MNEKQSAALASWHELNKHLNHLSEQDLKEMLVHEAANRRRSDVLTRIHQRFTAIRTKRERKELLMLGAIMEG